MKNLNEIISKYFFKNGAIFCNNLSLIIPAILRCGKANTALIAKEMSKFNGQDFHTNDTHLYRFLQSKDFQIDDSFWRAHIKLLFDFMSEQNLINHKTPIQINLDFTSNLDDFLILSASVIINDKAVLLYFTSRLYPKRKNQMDQKFMEAAFIKGLRHVLSKQYKYIIVADRGFGNIRFAKLCEENNFEYILRINQNLNIVHNNKPKNLKDFEDENIVNLECFANSWNKNIIVDIATKEGSTWFLLNGLKNKKSTISFYEKRFKIEKLFQDTKYSGFDIEKTKIRKYDRFKRLLYLIGLSHLFIVVLGNFLNTKENNIKKNSALHIKTLLAFLNWDLEQFPPSLINPSKSLMGFCWWMGDGVGE